MKRKIAGFLCVLLLLCAMLPSAAGAGTMYSMSVNDKLLDYSADTMPTVYEGMIYVPYTMFVSRYNGGIELGVFHSWNKKLNVLTLYSWDKPLLSFDIEAGIAYDMQDNVYPYKAILRNGVVYVPAQRVSSYFGLKYSAVKHAYGTLVRVKKEGDYYLDDAFLISTADQRLKEQKEAYERGQQPQVTPDPSPSPSAPVIEEPSQIQVYLAFRCGGGENLHRILDNLESYRVKGVFYFRPEILAERDDEIRRLLAGGHKIGFQVTEDTAQACVETAEEGNRLLKHIARARTEFLLVEQDDLEEELERQGWVCWWGNVNGIPKENTTAATLTANIYRSVDAKQSVARILTDDSETASTALERLLPRLMSEAYLLKTITEVSG